MTDLPMEPKRVYQPAQSPTMAFAYGEYFGCAGGQGTGEKGVGVGNGEDHADGVGAQGGRFFEAFCRTAADPEFGVAHREDRKSVV